MCNFTEEMFLRDYFAFEATLGKFCDRRAVFDCVGRYYLLGEDDRNRLFALASAPKVIDIATTGEFMRYRRICQYAEMSGINMGYTAEEDEIICVKGKALYQAHECKLIEHGDSTRASVYANIVDQANLGAVMALRIYGVLQCEGIFFERNLQAGLKNLSRGSRWNSPESTLALLYYDSQNRQAIIDRLNTLAAGTPFEAVATRAQTIYGVAPTGVSRECILLSKVFGRGQISPGVYNPVCANLLYSEIIGFSDKEKLLLSEGKDTINALVDLPLKLAPGKFLYDLSAVEGLAIKREDVEKALAGAAANGDICRLDTFRPLVLWSDSKYMLDYYAAAVTNMFAGAAVSRIYVDGLDGHDLESSMGNVFVRSCNEDTNNVYLLYFWGDIHEAVIAEVCSFLQSARRRRTRLVRPGLELDLGSVLPVCFCDRANAAALASLCDRVHITEPDRKERAALISACIPEKRGQYGLDGLEIEPDALDALSALSVDNAMSALDRAINANRAGSAPLVLTVENTKKMITKQSAARGYGYGGTIDEDK